MIRCALTSRDNRLYFREHVDIVYGAARYMYSEKFWRMFEEEQGRVTAVPDRSGNDPGRKWFRGSRMRNAVKFLSILFPRPHEQITKTASRFLFVFFCSFLRGKVWLGFWEQR